MGVTSEDFVAQYTIEPPAVTGAMVKVPVPPLGVPGAVELTPRMVTVIG